MREIPNYHSVDEAGNRLIDDGPYKGTREDVSFAWLTMEGHPENSRADFEGGELLLITNDDGSFSYQIDIKLGEGVNGYDTQKETRGPFHDREKAELELRKRLGVIKDEIKEWRARQQAA